MRDVKVINTLNFGNYNIHFQASFNEYRYVICYLSKISVSPKLNLSRIHHTSSQSLSPINISALDFFRFSTECCLFHFDDSGINLKDPQCNIFTWP